MYLIIFLLFLSTITVIIKYCFLNEDKRIRKTAVQLTVLAMISLIWALILFFLNYYIIPNKWNWDKFIIFKLISFFCGPIFIIGGYNFIFKNKKMLEELIERGFKISNSIFKYEKIFVLIGYLFLICGVILSIYSVIAVYDK